MRDFAAIGGRLSLQTLGILPFGLHIEEPLRECEVESVAAEMGEHLALSPVCLGLIAKWKRTSKGSLVLAGGLGVVQLQDGSVLGQKGPLLLLYNVAFLLLCHLFGLLFGFLRQPLLLQNFLLFLPQHLHLALVFLFAHATSLCVHLLETLILGELLHQLALEFVLHTLFLISPLGLQTDLVVFGGLELFTHSHTLLGFGLFAGLSRLFALLPVQLVAEVLLEFGLSAALVLLSLESLEDFVADSLCLGLEPGNGISTSLLLLGVASHHLIFVLVHFLLAFH